MHSFREIINQWPNLDAFAADIGVSVTMASQMRYRNRVSAKYWSKMIVGAERRGIDLTLEDMARIYAQEDAA